MLALFFVQYVSCSSYHAWQVLIFPVQEKSLLLFYDVQSRIRIWLHVFLIYASIRSLDFAHIFDTFFCFPYGVFQTNLLLAT